jgi:hypothetical protein
MAKTKTDKPAKVAPLTVDEFNEAAEPLKVMIGDQTLLAEPKNFKTGSFGFFITAKVSVLVGDTLVPCQVGCNIIVVGSKPAE